MKSPTGESRGERGAGATRLARAPAVSPRAVAAIVAGALLAFFPLPAWLLDVAAGAVVAGAVRSAIRAVDGLDRDPVAVASSVPERLLVSVLARACLAVAFVRALAFGQAGGATAAMWGPADATGALLAAATWGAIAGAHGLVVLRGAERAAEVAARFALDALPGAQLAIDAEVRSGAVDAARARAMRAALVDRANVFGGLDAATKLARGEAGALVAATFGLVALAAWSALGGSGGGALGFAAAARVGVARGAAMAVSLLAPALLDAAVVALALSRLLAAPSSTRVVETRIGRAIAASSLAVALAAAAFFPRAPVVVLLGAAFGIVAAWVDTDASAGAPGPRVATGARPARVVVRVAASSAGALARARASLDAAHVRLCATIGVPLPPFALERAVTLDSDVGASVDVLVDGVPIATPAADAGVSDPANDPNHAIERASRAVAAHAALLLDLDTTQAMVDALYATDPTLVAHAMSSPIALRTLRSVLRSLLAEGVCVADLRAIVEAIAADGGATRDPRELAEHARRSLARALTHGWLRGDAVLTVIELDAFLDETVRGALIVASGVTTLAMGPAIRADIVDAIGRARDRAPTARVLLCRSEARRFIREIVAEAHPDLAVTCNEELVPTTRLEIAARAVA